MNLQICCPFIPCPFKCPFCIAKYENDEYPFENIYQTNKKLWSKNLKRIIEIKKIKNIIITGETEPTLFPRFIKDVVKIANKMNITVELQTHNYNINPNIYKGLDVIAYSNTGKNILHNHNILKNKITREVFILTREIYENIENLLIYINLHHKDIQNYQSTIKYLQNNSHGDTNNKIIDKLKIELTDEEIMAFEKLNTKIDYDCQNSFSRYYIYRVDGKLYDTWNSLKELEFNF